MSEVLFAVDFDRTLGKTPELSELFAEAVAETGYITAQQMHAVQEQAQQTSISFDPYGYVRGQLAMGDKQFADITNRFYALAQEERNRDNLLYDDALPFLGRLAEQGVPTLIMTYGNPEWQHMKLRASGLDVWPHIITPSRRKGHEIAAWRSPGFDHAYVPQALRNPTFLATNHRFFHQVVLVDDKAVSFEGLPETASGYLIRRNTDLLPSQRGNVADGVTIVSSLTEVELPQSIAA